jgi:hypothetical protein
MVKYSKPIPVTAGMLGLWVRIPPGAWISGPMIVACRQVEVSASG